MAQGYSVRRFFQSLNLIRYGKYPNLSPLHLGRTGHTRLMTVVRRMSLNTGNGKKSKDVVIECQVSTIISSFSVGANSILVPTAPIFLVLGSAQVILSIHLTPI